MLARYLLAAILAVVGLVFIGQGLGYIGGSSMTNEPFWAIVGALMVVGAAIVAWLARQVTG